MRFRFEGHFPSFAQQFGPFSYVDWDFFELLLRGTEHSTFRRSRSRFSLFGDFTACERAAANTLRSQRFSESTVRIRNGQRTSIVALTHTHTVSARRSWFCIVIRAAYLVISGN
uniref:Uncharacterized protein LOC108039277 n=1 Tax=Drosophila rhopaloa TaxID=1041015 RepID=A0A6P4EED4_DRORH